MKFRQADPPTPPQLKYLADAELHELRVSGLREEALYPAIARFFEARGLPTWTEREIRAIRKLKMIPDVVAIDALTIIAVEAEAHTKSDDLNHAIGQATRFRSFAAKVYLAFPRPIPESFKDELRDGFPDAGLLEVDLGRRPEVMELICPTESKPSNMSGYVAWYRSLEDVKVTKAGKAWGEEPSPNMLLIRSVELDPREEVVRLSVMDPADDSTWERVHEVMRELDSEIYRAELPDRFGDDTRVELAGSDLFSMCSSCRHVRLISSPCACGEA